MGNNYLPDFVEWAILRPTPSEEIHIQRIQELRETIFNATIEFNPLPAMLYKYGIAYKDWVNSELKMNLFDDIKITLNY